MRLCSSSSPKYRTIPPNATQPPPTVSTTPSSCFPSYLKRPSRRRLRLLPRIPRARDILPHKDLLLLLRHRVLDPHLLAVLRHEAADEDRVPQLRRDAQVLAAAHQSVGFAAFG